MAKRHLTPPGELDPRIKAAKEIHVGSKVVLKDMGPDTGKEVEVEKIYFDNKGVPLTINVFYLQHGKKYLIQGLAANKWDAKF